MISTMFKLVLEILGKIGIYKSRTKVCPETPVFTLRSEITETDITGIPLEFHFCLKTLLVFVHDDVKT